MGSTTYGTMNDPKGGVAKVMGRTFEAMGQIPMFHRTYFLYGSESAYIYVHLVLNKSKLTTGHRTAGLELLISMTTPKSTKNHVHKIVHLQQETAL